MERYARFEILGRVGRGGMAEILLARERTLAGTTRHLVIKRILPEVADSDEMLHMFLDEARVVMGLSHPNLCQIFDVGEQDGTWFIAMEWVHGVTLNQLLRRALEGGMDYAVIARIISQCAEALHHAHTARDGAGEALNLVHRDVSPHNIIVAYDGRVKLLDFGIAKSAASTHHTEAGVVKGKVCYMAPEQWLSGPLDGRTDVFALGACLYEALTGRVVFKRDSQMEVMRAVLSSEVPALSEVAPEVPPQLAYIVHRAMSVAPEDRFHTALEMSEALEDFVSDTYGALGAAQVAEYARRLFPSEVLHGPVLERSMYGDEMAPPPMFLPPVPTQLLGPPKPLPRSLTIPPPSFLMNSPVAPSYLAGRDHHTQHQAIEFPSWVGRDQHTRPRLHADDAYDADADAPTGPLGVSVEQIEEALFTAESRLSPHEEDDDPSPITFSDIPTRPLLTALAEEQEHKAAPAQATERRAEVAVPELPDRTDPMARPLARTLSIPVSDSMRRMATLALCAGAAALLAVYGTLSWLSMRDGRSAMAPSARAAASGQQPAASARRLPPEVMDRAAPLASPVKGHDAPALVPQDAVPARVGMFPQLGPDEGLLSLDSRPWSTVYLGKQLLGTTPLIGVVVPKGPLSLRLVDGHGRVHVRRISRSEDETRRAFFDFESSRSAQEDAESARVLEELPGQLPAALPPPTSAPVPEPSAAPAARDEVGMPLRHQVSGERMHLETPYEPHPPVGPVPSEVVPAELAPTSPEPLSPVLPSEAMPAQPGAAQPASPT